MDKMNDEQSFWQFSEQLRVQVQVQASGLANLSLNNSNINNKINDYYSIWSNSYSSKRPDQRRNFDLKATTTDDVDKNLFSNNSKQTYSYSSFSPNSNSNNNNIGVGMYPYPYSYSYSYNNNNINMNDNLNIKANKINSNNKKQQQQQHGDNSNSSSRLKRVMAAWECVPRNERVGGYIFVCNNETMEENLKRKMFGLPPRYRDSVRSISPGLPLFLYNYSTHQLHGIFEAASFGGTNIDPTAWEDNKSPGESRFPAQVQVITRKVCEPLEEDSFRPILHHYDGPKFRLQLTVPEALSLLDIFADQNSFDDIFKAIPA